jgi:hypothetical protein
MTNGNEAHRDEWAADVARASDDMIAMAVQRHAEAEALREAQAVIDNAEWNALTPQEQEARIAEQDAVYEAYFIERAAENAAEAERYAETEDPEAEIG